MADPQGSAAVGRFSWQLASLDGVPAANPFGIRIAVDLPLDRVGQRIAARVRANRAKLQMELGSKNPMPIMEDCDMELAVGPACNAAFGGTGQKCTAASRLIVHRKVLAEFTERLAKAAEALRVGHALAEGTQIGLVIREGQLGRTWPGSTGAGPGARNC